LDSPWCKTLFGFALPALSGVFSGTFVAEICTSNGLDWRLAKTARSTYALVATIIVIYIYNRAVYLREKEVRQFSDSEFCVAYMRSQCLPEAAEQYKRLIREGQGGELKQAMDELKKILK